MIEQQDIDDVRTVLRERVREHLSFSVRWSLRLHCERCGQHATHNATAAIAAIAAVQIASDVLKDDARWAKSRLSTDEKMRLFDGHVATFRKASTRAHTPHARAYSHH